MLKNPLYVEGPKELYVPSKLNFGEFALNKFWSHEDKIAMINGATHEKITYRQIAQQTMNFAVSLTRLGVRRGQTVAILSENRQEFWGAVTGVICTGATLTAMNVGYTEGELKHTMNISRPKCVICSSMIYKVHQKTIKSLDYVKKIIVFGSEKIKDTLSYDDLAVNREGGNIRFEEFEAADVEGQSDPLLILYSSGTTGLPKGVVLTHLNVISTCCLPPPNDPTKLSLTMAPWFHAMGLVGTYIGLCNGRTAVYIAKFDVHQFLKLIEQYKIAQVTVVPPVLVAACKVESKYDLSSVELIYSGAAPLFADTVNEVMSKFPNLKAVIQGYGMTETTLAVCRLNYDDVDKFKPGTVGLVTAGNTMKVVDIETRKPLGPNQPGEICVKGNFVMKCYVGKSKDGDFDEEGFFKTGDIGYYDEDKLFFIVDRLKELIKYKAFQVAPAELEAVLLTHEGVKDVGVIGIPDKAAGEVPLAFVVPQPGVTLTEKEIQTFVAEKLSNPKHLRGGVRFVEQIPKSPSGKILRKDLRSMAKKIKNKL